MQRRRIKTNLQKANEFAEYLKQTFQRFERLGLLQLKSHSIRKMIFDYFKRGG